MKKLIYISTIILSAFFTLSSCDEYDDSSLKEDIAALEERVAALESYCSTLNSQISSLQSAVDAIEAAVYVTDVTTVTENGVTGYLITLSDGTSFTIYNGTDGEDGADGTTPVIGVTLVDGVYYWTLNGEIIYDSDGNPLRASGSDGEDGIVPQLKIEDGYWYVSYDGGTTWEQLGEVTDDTVQYITDLSYDSSYVYITLYDGSVITLTRGGSLSITFNLPEVGIVGGGESAIVSYTLTGADENTTVTTVAQNGYKAEVNATSTSEGTITITAPDEFVTGTIGVCVSNEVTTIVRVISVKFEAVLAVTDTVVTVSGDADFEFLLPVSANVEYTVSIPDDVDWISYSETRAVPVDSVAFAVVENDSRNERYTTVTLTSADSSLVLTVLVTQQGHNPTINDNWAIDYHGKVYVLSSTKYFDVLSFADGDGERYVTNYFTAAKYESYTLDSLFNYQQEVVDYYIDYYDEKQYEGYYLAKQCYTSYYRVQGSSAYTGGSNYYIVMFGVNDDGQLTGYYQVLYFTSKVLTGGSDAYNAWIGSWTYTDADENTNRMIFCEKEADSSYYMSYGSYSGTASSYWAEVQFDSSTGGVTLPTSTTYYRTTSTSASTGVTSIYYQSYVGRSYLGGSSLTYILEMGADIWTGAIASDGSATLTGCEVPSSWGTGEMNTFRVVGLDSTFSAVKSTSGSYPELTLPITLTYSESLTSN